MAKYLFQDYETRSTVNLKTVGLDRYATNPNTEVILAAYAFDDAPVQLWEPHKGDMPQDLADGLNDPNVTIVAWNAEFERVINEWVLGIPVPIRRYLDCAAVAKYMSLPFGLEDCGEALGLSEEDAKLSAPAGKIYEGMMIKFSKKDERTRIGTKLINQFCLPAIDGGEETLFGISEPFFRDATTDPEDWAIFCEYCKHDVLSERAMLRKMWPFLPPKSEQEVWYLDQEINSRGVYVDRPLVNGAVVLAEAIHSELDGRLKEITQIDNPNSRNQMLAWARLGGYPFNVLGKAFVNRALAEGAYQLTPEVREALTLRKQAAQTSDVKFNTIKEMVGSDGRLRHVFNYYGAARTGRWSGKDTQVQNLKRPVKELEKKYDLALDIVRAADLARLRSEFTSPPLDIITSVVRSSFCATPGNKLVICDLSAIENRGLGWVARCDKIMDVFAQGRDPYLDFGARMNQIAYDELAARYNAKDANAKQLRQDSKPAVLGAGYGLGGGDETETKDGDVIKTGLWGYADAMGIKLTQEFAHQSVQFFRQEYKEVVTCWYDLEEASIKCVQTGKPQKVGPIQFDMRAGVLRMLLPSGRALHYLEPQVKEREVFGKVKKSLCYMGIDQKTHQWTRIWTYGGKLIENAVQSISRDILVSGMFLAKKAGFPIVLHVHDELVAEVPKNSPLGIDDLRKCMSTPPSWAKGFPLDAAGFESTYYKKE